MATQPIGEQRGQFVPVEEYLSTVYEPDCEYDDGVVVERNLGEFEHSFLQAILATLFTNNMSAWGVFALTEQRIQIAPTQYRIPDVSVLRVGSPRESILTHPPLIAIEILSPEDTMRRASFKTGEYLRFGIEHIWVIDPNARVAYRGTDSGLELVPSGELLVPGTPVTVHIADLFNKLDRM
ncbi:MAG TPA: Uma2 family endonuclease [Terracidiphilus sp.]|jgi:Uma2 family endonuclease|nr:Uma2 family endonuclease [Terracidiphilus sp.]